MYNMSIVYMCTGLPGVGVGGDLPVGTGTSIVGQGESAHLLDLQTPCSLTTICIKCIICLYKALPGD